MTFISDMYNYEIKCVIFFTKLVYFLAAQEWSLLTRCPHWRVISCNNDR